MDELYKKFKRLTNFKGADIARTFGLSRQYVSLLNNNNVSKTNKSALALFMQIMIDMKINAFKIFIQDLETLKTEITNEILLNSEGVEEE